MKIATKIFRLYGVRIVAVLIIIALYWMSRQPETSHAERTRLARNFSFSTAELPGLPGQTNRRVRPVHPSLEHISSWISSVGASVALNDMDADGLPNDVCYVDTRTDRVIVAPVPGSPSRFPAFALEPSKVFYNHETMAPMGCLPGDINEDGLMDVVVYYWGRPPVAFLRQEAAKDTLSERSFWQQDIAPATERWYTNAATFADLDGDGHTDLVIGNYFPDGAHILDASGNGPTQQMQDSMSGAFNGGHDRLLLWKAGAAGAQPKVEYVDAQGVLSDEVANGWTLAIAATDLDGDMLPELYLANDFGPDRLLHNRSKPGELHFTVIEGRRGLTTPKSKIMGRDSFKGMGVDTGDLNGDGIPDIYVSNIAAEYALEESHFMFLSTGDVQSMKQGIAPYVDYAEPLGLSRSGWAWEARLADFNNDGTLEALQATGFVKGEVNRWPELHELAMGNDTLLHVAASWPRFQPGDALSAHDRNPFFVRAADGRFCDLAPELHLEETGASRGIATADVDGDGKLDYAVANQWAASVFHQNQSQQVGDFLGLYLRVALSQHDKAENTVSPGHGVIAQRTRPAIGASAIVYLPDGRKLAAQVDGGNGHSGKRSPDLHFGLGRIPQNTSLKVELRWRDPEGRIHQDILQLAPGWHTVMLGWKTGKES